MTRRTSIMFAGLAISFASVARAQAPAAGPRPPAPVASVEPVPLPPPGAAPAPPVSRPALRFAAPLASSRPIPMAAPAGSVPPDSLGRRAERVALVSPKPLERPVPTRRVREFGLVRTDVARQSPPAGVTGRCKDGTYLTVPPSEEACAGKGGLFIRVPHTPGAPAAPVAQGRRQ